MLDHNNRDGDFGSKQARWSAVLSKDSSADGAFLYAVKTTGIYCRPSCSSRRPNAENVEFFEKVPLAEEAGYRACKKCRPGELADTHPHQHTVLDACRFIEEEFDEPSLSLLADRASLSPFHFQRVFKSIIGLTPKQYAKALREKHVRSELINTRTVTDAIFDAGYNSSGRFYVDAQSVIGMSPTKRRAQGLGETIHFALGECSLGSILVATTNKGICDIILGDNPETLLENFQSNFSDAELIADDEIFETLIANVVGLIDCPDRNHALPLDIQGTAFQKKVWQALSAIPCGQTVSYADVAKKIGKPTAMRAVAQACGANRLAVAIPCHRVVRSDGSISGYRWGVQRKERLLVLEKAT